MEATGTTSCEHVNPVQNLPFLQFLKFQAFAEQLTKETQDLKVKIETHKRENRRLTVLIDQQKDDTARLTVRLSGTEKQRDDALEALVLQQDIAEELERERKRNKKELLALQHTNATIIRQRDESQRVVLHLRSLINGQTHHMEHIIRSLNKTPEPGDYSAESFEDATEDLDDKASIEDDTTTGHGLKVRDETQRSYSRASTTDGKFEGENVNPDMESRFFGSIDENNGRGSRLSIVDVADRHLRDKTDAIADIIRNISQQCAAAVEGLQLAHDAEQDGDDLPEDSKSQNDHLGPSDAQKHSRNTSSETGEVASENGEGSSFLSPDGRNSRTSTIPPTPDLVHNRSSTSMSGYSASTVPDRSSQQYHPTSDVATKIRDQEEEDGRSEVAHSENGEAQKGVGESGMRPATARIVA